MKTSEPDEGYEVGTVSVINSTDRAVLCRLPDGDEEWFPKSQLKEGSEIVAASVRGDEGVLLISTWLAKQKGYAE